MSKQKAARLGDIDTGHPPSPPTPIITGSTNVFTNGRPAARKGDKLVPHHPGIRIITEGSTSVLINGKPAARVTDSINCGGKIAIGSGNVLIGDSPEKPRNVKTQMEFEAIMDAGFETENRNLTPYQQAELEAAIAVKYNPEKGSVPVWHEYYMGNAPETGDALTNAQQAGYEKAQAEKSELFSEAIEQKQVNPESFEDARDILKARREQIKANGYQAKFNDQELSELAKNGNVGDERFQVRFMEKSYLQDRDTPDIPLSGKLGGVMEGTTGKGAKYWSTSFDQIEDADSDPRLLCGKLGLEYDEEKEYALIIIDNDKAIPLTGVKTVPATFKKVSGFANKEFPLDFPNSFTDKVMTSEFQEKYAKQYKAAVDAGDLPDQSKDTRKFKMYLDSTSIPENEKAMLIQRMEMHRVIGNNQHYTGDGLTKNLIIENSNKRGAVETLNFERKEITLDTLNQNNALIIIDDLKPL